MDKTLIVGANRGIGLAFVKARLARGDRVIGACRQPEMPPLTHERLTWVRLDVTDESSVAMAAATVRDTLGDLDRLIHTVGVLHGADFGPEKRLAHVEPDVLSRVFAVNAFGPLVVAKHFARLLQHERRAVFAALSARVGSITDNGLGGWYAYRASKAALNQFLKTLSIEWSRTSPRAIVVSLHPGTVDTDLSAPFQGRVPPEKLFSTERAVRQLLDIIEGLTPDDTGTFVAWDGTPIPW
ncbi:MAG: SDR family NAD(P)-dependent oxidoreductase [Myxococcota bacterium]